MESAHSILNHEHSMITGLPPWTNTHPIHFPPLPVAPNSIHKLKKLRLMNP